MTNDPFKEITETLKQSEGEIEQLGLEIVELLNSKETSNLIAIAALTIVFNTMGRKVMDKARGEGESCAAFTILMLSGFIGSMAFSLEKGQKQETKTLH